MVDNVKMPPAISKHLLRRLPNYLNYLSTTCKGAMQNVSAPTIAKKLGLNEVQVRKDLATVSRSGGRPRTGFDVDELIKDIEAFLGYDNIDEAILVGAGNLGKALLQYKGFDNYGLKIVAAFDNDEAVIGSKIGGKQVLPVDKLQDFCRRSKIHIGIITVPAEHAKSVCNEMVNGGILAIWNFAPEHLDVPDHVLVQNENMVVSLVTLSKHLSEKITTTSL